MEKNKTTRARRTFTPQFKREAVKFVNEGKTVPEVARGLGTGSLIFSAVVTCPHRAAD